MKRINFLGTAGLFALLLTGTSVAQQAQRAPQPQPQPAPRAILTATQAMFDSYVAAKKLPGITGAFGMGDAPTVFVSAGRIADDANAPAAGPDSLWRIYSMTKPITGIAAMLLIEDGKLQLDQPLSDFFPAFKSMKRLTNPDTSLDAVPAKNPILIRHLLTHTAGLSYSISAKGPLLKEYERLGLLPASVNAAMEPQMRAARPATLAAFAERAAQAPLIAEPGTVWKYSMSLDVLGAVIEKASGMPFDRFVQTRILDPLDMRSTYWSVPAADAARLSTNYVWVGENRVPLDPGATSVYLTPPSFAYGGAGLVSSARDYDRFLHMLQNLGSLGSVRIMKTETAQAAMSNLMPTGVPVTLGRTSPGDVPVGFGAGGSVYLVDKPGGPSKGTFGWGGAAGTIAWVDPARRMRGTVMVQYFPDDRWPIRADVATALAADAARLRQ